MRDRLAEFADAEVVVITFAAADDVAAYQAERLAPLRVLVDEDRVSYRAYQLGRGRLCQIWGPKIWWTYVKLIARGRRLHWPTEDSLQLGGDFVVGSDGRIRYAFRSADP
ncbi:MAG: SelL-related redox protein, partial [Actinomycetota bacterium]|nr:SelL-related redox protein [Actinomycetota bacterium]